MLQPTIGRLVSAFKHATGHPVLNFDRLWSLPLEEPNAIRAELAVRLGGAENVIVTGTRERRLVLLRRPRSRSVWTITELCGLPLNTREWPAWASSDVTIDLPGTWISAAVLTPAAEYRFQRPRLLIASLCHSELLPAVRFPLAISTLARAVRGTLLGRVELLDMQLGATLDGIVDRAVSGRVDILGVSVTVGQHDLLVRLLDQVSAMDTPPTVVVGGSLPVRIEEMLLERYPQVLICRAAGEPTIAELVAHWHGDLTRDEVSDLVYRTAPEDGGRICRTPKIHNTDTDNAMCPEFDLLDDTFHAGGAAQLETSRGCIDAGSSCAREQKGFWVGASTERFNEALQGISDGLREHPDHARVVHLLDEEFIGPGEGAAIRAWAMAKDLHRHNLSWETSSRVGQVHDPAQSYQWHVERAHLWRGLLGLGLRRCLFEVESGVDTILDRFDKRVTADQNSIAIRTLTALGVPPRFTYTTFDPMMTIDELWATHHYLGRTDLLLRPVPGATVDQIVTGVRRDDWVAEHSTGHPLYTEVPSPLVVLEMLVRAPCTSKAEAAGLIGRVDPQTGRVEAHFADPRIGVLAAWAQRFIDRNFALDSHLKGLSKVNSGPIHHLLRAAGTRFNQAAYNLLGDMLVIVATAPEGITELDAIRAACEQAANERHTDLRATLAEELTFISEDLPVKESAELQLRLQRWAATDGWQLINAGYPGGTT